VEYSVVSDKREDRLNDDRGALRNLNLAFKRTNRNGKLTDSDLQIVVDAASSPHTVQRDTAVGVLATLSCEYLSAADAVLAMSKSKKSNVGFAAACSLAKKTPTKITDAVLKSLLLDTSINVRWKAAEVASSLVRRKLLSDLAAALSAETHPKVKRSMQFSLALLRDGYKLELEPSGDWTMAIRLSNGIVGIHGTKAELESNGPKAIASAR
jgi:hypothetical protein